MSVASKKMWLPVCPQQRTLSGPAPMERLYFEQRRPQMQFQLAIFTPDEVGKLALVVPRNYSPYTSFSLRPLYGPRPFPTFSASPIHPSLPTLPKNPPKNSEKQSLIPEIPPQIPGFAPNQRQFDLSAPSQAVPGGESWFGRSGILYWVFRAQILRLLGNVIWSVGRFRRSRC